MQKELFLSYSQDFEDLILYNYLFDVKNGFYLDIGANHPWFLSVTKSFYARGWSGVNIEPDEESYDLLRKDRPRDLNLKIAIGNKEGLIPFCRMGALSSGNKEMIKKYTEANAQVIVDQIPVKKLSTIILENKLEGREVHFCKIDVEKMEKEVLEGIDFSTFRPWLFAIESTEPESHCPCFEKWENIFLNNEYFFAFESGINRFYISKEQAELAERTLELNELMEKYDVFNVCKKLQVWRAAYRLATTRADEANKKLIEQKEAESEERLISVRREMESQMVALRQNYREELLVQEKRLKGEAEDLLARIKSDCKEEKDHLVKMHIEELRLQEKQLMTAHEEERSHIEAVASERIESLKRDIACLKNSLDFKVGMLLLKPCRFVVAVFWRLLRREDVHQ